jgi:hypothetical protein
MHSETPNSEQSIPSLLVPLKETNSHAKWSTTLLVSNPFFIVTRYTHSIHLPDSPSGSLVLNQTTADNTDARHCTPSPSSLILTLLNMHPYSKARIPQVIIIPRHQPFISAFTKLLGQVAGVAEKFQQPAKSLWKLTSTPIYPLFCLSTTFFPSPHQYGSIPHHHSRHLFPMLHNTPTKRKASPCIVCNNNGEIPAAKMTANKTKSKPQKHVVFTPVRWPVVWSQWIVELWKEKKPLEEKHVFSTALCD